MPVVGKVSQSIPPEVRDKLNRKSARIKREAPFISCRQYKAVWLDPVVTCRCRFKKWSFNNRLVHLQFEILLVNLN